LDSQPFLYVCRAIYNSNGDVTTQEYDYNIFYIDTLIVMRFGVLLITHYLIQKLLVDTFVIVDVGELNNVLRTSWYPQVDEDDNSDEINIEYCDGNDNDEIEEEEDNYD